MDAHSCGELPIISCATNAEELSVPQHLINVLETTMASLKEVGVQSVVASIENEIRKEKRRVRASSRDDLEVRPALPRQREQDLALER